MARTEKKLAEEVSQLAKEMKGLTKEAGALGKEVEKLKNLEFIQVFKHPWKFMGFSLLKGLMIGFGSVLGASVLVAIFVFILSQIRLVPYLGEFIQDIIDEVQMVDENN